MIFTKSLKKNYQFRTVYNKGKSIANRYLVVYVLKNGRNFNRIGFSVSKKVGISVVRSRVTRLIRENYRLSEKKVKRGFDIVVIARTSCGDASFKNIGGALLHLIKKHNLWNG